MLCIRFLRINRLPIKSKNKILFLTLYTFSLTGGIEKVCRAFARALGDLGKPFVVYAMHDKPADLNPKYLEANHFKAFNSNKFSFALAAIWKGIRSETIILSHINLLLFARIIKTISPKAKIILYAHGIEVWGELSPWKKKFLQKKVHIWAVSEFTATKIEQMHQVGRKNITIVHNCLDPFFVIPTNFEKPLHLRKRYHLQAGQPIIFTLTRLSASETYKGYDRILQAMPALLIRFPDLHYLIAGKADAEELSRVNTLINKLGLTQQVTLTGFIADDELSDHFKLANLFVMPSTHEGFGIVFIEAASCGTTSIGGNADGSVDALLQGKLGTLVKPDNIVEIGEAIAEKLTATPSPLEIQELCLSNFAYQKYVTKINQLI